MKTILILLTIYLWIDILVCTAYIISYYKNQHTFPNLDIKFALELPVLPLVFIFHLIKCRYYLIKLKKCLTKGEETLNKMHVYLSKYKVLYDAIREKLLEKIYDKSISYDDRLSYLVILEDIRYKYENMYITMAELKALCDTLGIDYEK